MLGYATYTLVKEPDALPGGPYAALIADTIWIPTMRGGHLAAAPALPDRQAAVAALEHPDLGDSRPVDRART